MAVDERYFALLRGDQLEAVRCAGCGRVLLKVDQHFGGAIQVKCRGCKTVNIIRRVEQ